MLGSLTAAIQIRDDLSTLMDDVQRGRPTYPIAVIAQAAGISLQPWPDALELLGAMIASRSHETGARASAHPNAVVFPAVARASPPNVHGLSRGRNRPTRASCRANPRGRCRRPSRSGVRKRLLGFGGPRAPSSGRWRWPRASSWPTRHSGRVGSRTAGMFGSDLVVSRFPAGLVLEILEAHGHDVAMHVDDFLAVTVANGFGISGKPGRASIRTPSASTFGCSRTRRTVTWRSRAPPA